MMRFIEIRGFEMTNDTLTSFLANLIYEYLFETLMAFFY